MVFSASFGGNSSTVCLCKQYCFVTSAPKRPKTFFPAKIRGATDVLIHIRSLSTGAVHLVFPKQAEDLRELIKQHLKVDEMRACHWHPKAGVWSNMTYDSIPTKPVLTAHPHDFIRAAIELFDSSELVSSWSILGPDPRPSAQSCFTSLRSFLKPVRRPFA